jgi:hypothetical protein
VSFVWNGGSSVGIVTTLRIAQQRNRDSISGGGIIYFSFQNPSTHAPGPTQPPPQEVPGAIFGGKRGSGVKLTSHFLLVLSLRFTGVIYTNLFPTN